MATISMTVNGKQVSAPAEGNTLLVTAARNTQSRFMVAPQFSETCAQNFTCSH